MKAEVYWLTNHFSGNLGIMARPRGGEWLEDEVMAWKRETIGMIVSLLTAGETIELNLSDEAAICQDHGIRFISFPIPDKGVPSSHEAIREMIAGIVQHLNGGEKVAIHCRMGIGRSALICACVLGQTGVSANEAFEQISRARGLDVPDTDEQIEWVDDYAAHQ